MNTVIIPYRPGDLHRERAWERVKDQWSGWHWYATDDGDEPFSRAQSINQGVAEHPANVYVIADADILIDRRQVETAVALANHSPGLVVAFERWAHLTESGTNRVLDGYNGSWEPFVDITWPSISACVAVSAETWRLTGGFPPLRGWGMEDVCFEIACRTLAGPTRRIPGTAWHLWHPSEANRPNENVELLRKFEAAAGDPQALTALLASV